MHSPSSRISRKITSVTASSPVGGHLLRRLAEGFDVTRQRAKQQLVVAGITLQHLVPGDQARTAGGEIEFVAELGLGALFAAADGGISDSANAIEDCTMSVWVSKIDTSFSSAGTCSPSITRRRAWS